MESLSAILKSVLEKGRYWCCLARLAVSGLVMANLDEDVKTERNDIAEEEKRT